MKRKSNNLSQVLIDYMPAFEKGLSVMLKPNSKDLRHGMKLYLDLMKIETQKENPAASNEVTIVVKSQETANALKGLKE